MEISDPQGEFPVNELEIWGSETDAPEPPIVPVEYQGDALKIGLNGFSWVPQDLNPTANLRMYQMYQWTWTPTGIAVEPTWEASSEYDSYLQEAKEKKKTVIFCVNKIPNWYSDITSDPQYQWFPIRKSTSNPTSPFSYKDVASYAFQIAARYGSVQVPDSVLVVNQVSQWGEPVNIKKSGLDLIRYLEFENEPDRPWMSEFYSYSPQEMAAFCSAIWDGHEGQLGSNVGVKNADSNLKIVLPSLSTIDLWYLNEMKKWFDLNRSDKRFCADVISVHHYCNTANTFPSNHVNLWGYGSSPETDHFEERIKEFNMFVRQNFPDVEVWFGEFGYDTNLPSTTLTQFPQLYGNHTAEELQSQWNLRTFLYGLASGMDKVMAFNLCDEDSAPQGYLFGSCGFLTSQSTGYKKKQSWKDLDRFTREINGFEFYKDRSIDGVRIFEFRSAHMTKFFYFSPTSNDSTKGFKIGRKRLTATETVQVYSIDRTPFFKLKIK